MTSKPAPKKIDDLDLALTPPENKSLFGNFFLIIFAQCKTWVSCCENIDVMPTASYLLATSNILSSVTPVLIMPLGNSMDLLKKSSKLSSLFPTQAS